jgi:enoyl-[acyl-carrier protein] reductase II
LYKKLVFESGEGDTKLLLKALHPVRLLKSPFFAAVEKAEARGAGIEELKELLGRARAKKGIFEGNLEEGEFEVGQVAAYLKNDNSVSEIMGKLLEELKNSMDEMRLKLSLK